MLCGYHPRKGRLYLTCARQRMIFDRTTMNKLSRFVSEIPEEHLHKNTPSYEKREKTWEERKAQHRPRFKDKGLSFCGLRARDAEAGEY